MLPVCHEDTWLVSLNGRWNWRLWEGISHVMKPYGVCWQASGHTGGTWFASFLSSFAPYDQIAPCVWCGLSQAPDVCQSQRLVLPT